MKDKIIEMDNGKNYYILEEEFYQGKKYLLSVECDVEKDEIKEEEYLVMELILENNDLQLKAIENNKIATIVINKMINKIKNN